MISARLIAVGKTGLLSFVFLLGLMLPGRTHAIEQATGPDPIMRLLKQGQEAMQHGNLTQAEALFRQAAAAAPQLSDVYLALGLVELRRGGMDEAIQSLTRATELNARLPGAHLFLGIAQYQTGQSAAAVDALRAEIALDPASTQALTWLGIVELGTGHPGDATSPLDQAAALSPADPNILYYRGRAHTLVAEAVYQQLYKIDPDSSLVHRALAEGLDASGQPEKAIAEYEAAIKKDPSNPDLYEALGDSNQKMGRIDAARAAYEEGLKFNPHSAIALYNVGRIDVERGKPEGGVALLRQAEALHSSPAPTYFYLGLGLAELGQNAEAAQWLEKSLTSQPSPFIEQGAWYQLGRVYQKLNRRADAQHALDQLKQLLARLQQQKEITAKEAAGKSAPSPTPPTSPHEP